MKWGCTPPPFQITGKMRLLTNEWFIKPLSQWCKKLNASQDKQKIFAFRHHSVFFAKVKNLWHPIYPNSSKLPDDFVHGKTMRNFHLPALQRPKTKVHLIFRFHGFDLRHFPWCRGAWRIRQMEGWPGDSPRLFWNSIPRCATFMGFLVYFTYIYTIIYLHEYHKTSTK